MKKEEQSDDAKSGYMHQTIFWDAIILDEAGCVPEWKMPALTRFNPKLLIMVGDHKQLPPFTDLPQRKRDVRVVSILEVFDLQTPYRHILSTFLLPLHSFPPLHLFAAQILYHFSSSPCSLSRLCVSPYPT